MGHRVGVLRECKPVLNKDIQKRVDDIPKILLAWLGGLGEH